MLQPIAWIMRLALAVVLLLPMASARIGLAQQDNNLVYEIFARSFADTPGDKSPVAGKGEVGDFKGISKLGILISRTPLGVNGGGL